MFSKPISVYVMLILLGLLIGTALYAQKQKVRTSVLLERIEYYKVQISNFDSALAAHKVTCAQSEILMQTTKESTVKLDQKGKEFNRNIESLKPPVPLPRKADEPIKDVQDDDGASDRALHDSMWNTFCKTTPHDAKCIKR